MLGDLVGTAGSVVRDEQSAGRQGAESLDRAGSRLVSPEDGAVQVEQQAVMKMRKGFHVRTVP